MNSVFLYDSMLVAILDTILDFKGGMKSCHCRRTKFTQNKHIFEMLCVILPFLSGYFGRHAVLGQFLFLFCTWEYPESI